MTILLVDDDAAARSMLALTLRQTGLQVMAVGSGDEAVHLLERTRYDCLITDAKMEPMDGFKLARFAKRLQPKLRIVLISAICDESDLAGTAIEKCFCKPFHPEDMVAWLRGHCSQNGTSQRH